MIIKWGKPFSAPVVIHITTLDYIRHPLAIVWPLRGCGGPRVGAGPRLKAQNGPPGTPSLRPGGRAQGGVLVFRIVVCVRIPASRNGSGGEIEKKWNERRKTGAP